MYASCKILFLFVVLKGENQLECYMVNLLIYAYLSLPGKDYANNERSVTSEEFVVDSSPPATGVVLFDGRDSVTNYITGSTLRLRLERFYDHHSGIDHYNVGVGSSPDMADVVLLLNYQSNLIDISLALTGVVDGHKYYIIVQVIWPCS